MSGYFARSLAAQIRGGRTLFVLAVAGVALGVAAVLSIQILNQSALAAFGAGVRAVSGDARLAVVGRGPTLADSLLPLVLTDPDVRAALPLYRVDVALEGSGGSLEVIGTDLFAPGRVPWDLGRGELADVLARPGWVAVTPQLAADMGWRRGGRRSHRSISSPSQNLDLPCKRPVVRVADISVANGVVANVLPLGLVVVFAP